MSKLAASFVPILAAALGAQDTEPPTPWWPDAVQQAVQRAGDNGATWRGALERVPEAQRDGLAFLIEHMPEHDLRSLTAPFVLENVDLAYAAIATAPWGDRVPTHVFLDAVLPYAHVTEPRDPWRREFRDRFLPLVADCATPAEAAQRLNQKVFGELGVRYSTKRKRADQSARESIESGLASCTGLSIVLANACRAVGVPARLAAIPRWVNKRGNHTWLEVWDGDWHFTGAAEPSAQGLDHAWFQGDAALAKAGSQWNAILAVSWRPTARRLPMVWAPRDDSVWAVDVTERYARQSEPDRTTRLMVSVRASVDGERVAVPVSVAPAADPTSRMSGTSRGESADTNDLLTFEVPTGGDWIVHFGDGRSKTVTVDAAEQLIVEVTLDGSAPADSAPAAAADDDALREAAAAWFAASEDERGDIAFDPKFDERLLQDDASVRQIVWRAYREAPIHAELRADYEARRVRWREHESPFVAKTVGDRPERGWGLFIAMHGGGGVPKRVNDQQWRVMQRYYVDQDSVPGYRYVALRAPNDNWNGFYDDTIAMLVAELIRQFVTFADVDPDRVFLMGYSHGGYGAFAIGPKIADRFAAVHASAAAPTPGVTAARNLRNTVFTYMVGEHDTAYGRADRCRAFDAEIEALRGERDDIYPVTFEFEPGHRHGGLPDRGKIRPMSAAVRDPAPREVSWQPTDGHVRQLFWISVDEPASGMVIDATCRDNQIAITATDVDAVRVHLDARLVDFDEPIAVAFGERMRTVEPRPSVAELCRSMLERGDPELAHTARLDVQLR